MPLSHSPLLTPLPPLFATIFLAFGTSYMLYPRYTFPLFGFSASPSTPADWALMDAVMVLYGVRDVFMGVVMGISVGWGTRKSTGLIMVAAGLCAGVDGWVVKQEAGVGEWNHWGYGGVMGVVGLVMAGVFG